MPPRRSYYGTPFCTTLPWRPGRGPHTLHTMNAPQRLIEDLAHDGLKTASPGAAIAALGPEGLLQAAAGVSSLRRGDPLRVDHRFAIGSITKTVVAVVIHQLAAQGVLDLNATPADYLDAATIAGIANADRAPLRTMLDHTSGIPTWEFDPAWIRRGRGDLFEPGHPFAKAETLSYLRGRYPPVNPVGERYSYSNTNHTLLGLIIERTTGRTFESEARCRVLNPQCLSSFALESFEPIPSGALAIPHHLATPFFRERAGVSPHFVECGDDVIDTSAADLSPEWAAGGYVATVADLCRYGHALMTNAYGESVGSAMRAFRDVDGAQRRPYRLRVAPGLFEFDVPRGPVAGHFGGTLGHCAALLFPPSGRGTVLAVGLNLGRMHTDADGEAEHSVWKRWIVEEVYARLA